MLLRRVPNTRTEAPFMANGPRPHAELADGLLRRNGDLCHRKIWCEYREGVLTLRGYVPTYYLKQLAQIAVAGIPQVRLIINEIEVL